VETTWARWRATIERAVLSVEERWVKGVAHDPEGALVACHLASWWLECGRVREATRYALAALALDPSLWRQADGVLERLSVKCKAPKREWLVEALVADLEGA
jgi:hypothetical protein